MNSEEQGREGFEGRLGEAEAIVEAIRKAEAEAPAGGGGARSAAMLGAEADRAVRAIMELMREGAAMLDAEGRVLHCNARLGEMLRRVPRDLVGQSFASFVHSRDAEKWQSAFGSQGRQAALGFMLEVLVPAGQSVPVHIAICPLGAGGDRIAFLVASELAWQEERMKQLERVTRELAQQKEDLEEVATTDSTTGAYTSGAALEVLQTEIAYGRRYGTPVSVLLMDIDHFKFLNDSYGHAFGDTILKEFCDRCRAAIRATDYLVRYGGDEFVVILPQSGPSGAQAVGERILGSVRAAPFGQDTRGVPVTVSVGVATAQAGEEVPAGVLLKRADQALYEVKEGGRDGLAHWDGKSLTDHGRG